MPRKSRGRNRKRGKVEKEYCQGYLDKYGQWNNGFYCIKFTKKANTKFCCGDQFTRYCCKPPGTGGSSIVSTPDLGTGPHTRLTTRGQTNKSAAATTLESTRETSSSIDIPLIAGVAAGGAVVILFFIILCCCVCPCCPNKRRQRQQRKKVSKAQESREGMHEPDVITRDGTMSDSDTISTAMMYPVSPTPTSQTSLPSSTSTHDSHGHLTEPLMLTGPSRHAPYKVLHSGMMVSAVPTYLHDDLHSQDAILQTMKPITFGQLKNRFPDIYPNEEIDPYTLTSGLSQQDFGGGGQSFTNMSHGRLMRPSVTSSLTHYHSPGSNLRAHMHSNRYAL